jgi:hypothetical protein
MRCKERPTRKSASALVIAHDLDQWTVDGPFSSNPEQHPSGPVEFRNPQRGIEGDQGITEGIQQSG